MEVILKFRRRGIKAEADAVTGEAQSPQKTFSALRWATGSAGLALLLLVPLFLIGGRNSKDSTAKAVTVESDLSGLDSPIEISSLNLSRSAELAVVQGTVKNRSPRPLQYIWVQAAFYDRNNRFLTKSVDGLIDVSTLLPNETSRFKVYGVWDAAIDRCRLEFSQMARKTVAVTHVQQSMIPEPAKSAPADAKRKDDRSRTSQYR